MMLANLFHHPPRVLAACCLLALSGCANQPLQTQLAASQDAVNQAKIAGASEHYPADFGEALDKLNRANAAASAKHKDDAMRLAQQAQVDANLARAKTDSAQARFAAAELVKSNQILLGVIARQDQNQQR